MADIRNANRPASHSYSSAVPCTGTLNTVSTVSEEPEVLMADEWCTLKRLLACPVATTVTMKCNKGKIRRATAISGQTGSRNMAETGYWTRSHRLPIHSPIHYGVYLDSIYHFTLETLIQGPLLRGLDLDFRVVTNGRIGVFDKFDPNLLQILKADFYENCSICM